MDETDLADIPWEKPAELQFFHSRLDENGEVRMTSTTVQNLSLRMAVQEACVQRQGAGFSEMSIALVDGTAVWRGDEIAKLAKQL